MRCRRPALLLALLLAVGQITCARDDVLLTGPLLAVNNAVQDRIFLYDVATGAQRHLNFGSGWHMVWGFTASGCRLVLTLSDGPALPRLFTARLDGSDLRELVAYNELPSGAWGIWEPQPSPDGTLIAFTMMRDRPDSADREYRIARVPAAGGPPEFYSVSGDEHEPAWSPDGRWLAYISFDRRVPGQDINATAAPTPPGQTLDPALLLREADLWVVSADGQTKYRLTDFPTGSVRAPRWSPDGELLSFIYSPTGGNDQFWMIANAAGAFPTQLSLQWSLILDTTWFPDSAAILGSAREFRGVRQNVLWKIPLVGVADDLAVRYLEDPALIYADYPRFSPDSRYLALRTAYALTLVDTTAGAITLLDSIPLANTPPVWSPADFPGEAACSSATG